MESKESKLSIRKADGGSGVLELLRRKKAGVAKRIIFLQPRTWVSLTLWIFTSNLFGCKIKYATCSSGILPSLSGIVHFALLL